MNNHKKNSGFTLIEMMVTVAIVGIFASIALPSFARLIESNRINTATNELVSNLLLARSEALKRRNTVTLCPSTDQQNCSGSSDFSTGWIVFLDCNDNTSPIDAVAGCGANGTEEIIKVSDGFSSIAMDNLSVDKVSFGFSGRLAENPSTFQIGKDATTPTKRIVLNRVGRVRAETIPE